MFKITAQSVAPGCSAERRTDRGRVAKLGRQKWDPDREKLNLILLDRYIISYEAYNSKGHVTDFPLTLQPESQPTSGTLTIPPRSAAVVMEQ